MSYSIDSWKQIGGGELRIHRNAARRLKKQIANWRPESFLEDLAFGEDERAIVNMRSLRGECSGHCYTEHIDAIAASLEGEADFVIVWEGGDSVSGLRISGGKAIEMDVAFSLVERVNP